MSHHGEEMEKLRKKWGRWATKTCLFSYHPDYLKVC